MAVYMESGVPIRPLSVDDYFRMWEIGIFAEDEQIELLRGVVVEKPTPTPPHDNTIERLTMQLVPLAIAAGVSVRVQSTTVFEEQDSVPQPDLAVVETGHLERDVHPTFALIAIEVSVSSLRLDTTFKANLYAEVGIPEYWVLDVRGRTLLRHTEPHPNGYAVIERLGPDDEVQAAAVPAFPPLRVAEMLGG